MRDRYILIGNPVSHSLSPLMHRLFAEQTQQTMTYELQAAPLTEFKAVLEKFFHEGGKGCNVTLPFKEQAAQAVACSERAQLAGAVNTILPLADGRLWGDNTDGIGLIRDLQDNHGYQVADKNLLILGAGGAVRGILGPLLAQKPRSIVIANRTPAKAAMLVANHSSLANLFSCDLKKIEGAPFDLIINGISAAVKGESLTLPDHLLTVGGWCYDLAYGVNLPFLTWGEQQGASRCLDGIGMLVEQGAEAFNLWRGQRPVTGAVITYLREFLQSSVIKNV